jgi:uncharacterized lipoprotein YajG
MKQRTTVRIVGLLLALLLLAACAPKQAVTPTPSIEIDRFE